MNQARLDVLISMIRSEIFDRREKGKLNYKIPVLGDVALMYDKIERYFEHRDETEILGYVVDGIVALDKLVEEDKSHDLDTQIGMLEEYSLTDDELREQMKEAIHGSSPKEIPDNEEVNQQGTESTTDRRRKQVQPVHQSRKAPRSKRGKSGS